MMVVNSSICLWKIFNCSGVALPVATSFIKPFNSASDEARAASIVITGS
jgi:hypothetical protein